MAEATDFRIPTFDKENLEIPAFLRRRS